MRRNASQDGFWSHSGLQFETTLGSSNRGRCTTRQPCAFPTSTTHVPRIREHAVVRRRPCTRFRPTQRKSSRRISHGGATTLTTGRASSSRSRIYRLHLGACRAFSLRDIRELTSFSFAGPCSFRCCFPSHPLLLDYHRDGRQSEAACKSPRHVQRNHPRRCASDLIVGQWRARYSRIETWSQVPLAPPDR